MTNRILDKLTQRYLENALWIDLVVIAMIGLLLFVSLECLSCFGFFSVRSSINIALISTSTIGATLIGFLLTILTVLITFKHSYDQHKKQQPEIQPESAFEQKTDKISVLYDSGIYKNVVNVFLSATYEVAVVLIVSLFLQSEIILVATSLLGILALLMMVLLILSLTRCLHIFKLFLRHYS